MTGKMEFMIPERSRGKMGDECIPVTAVIPQSSSTDPPAFSKCFLKQDLILQTAPI